MTLKHADTVDHYVYDRVTVAAPFDRISDVYRLVTPPDVILVNENFGDTNEFAFDVRQSKRDDFLKSLAARRLTPR